MRAKREKSRRDVTPRSIIKHAMRMMWLRSRERVAALKRDGYTCQVCGRKQSQAKGKEFSVEVDHLDGEIDWNAIIEYIRRHLLVSPDRLQTICRTDHAMRTLERRQLEALREK